MATNSSVSQEVLDDDIKYLASGAVQRSGGITSTSIKALFKSEASFFTQQFNSSIGFQVWLLACRRIYNEALLARHRHTTVLSQRYVFQSDGRGHSTVRLGREVLPPLRPTLLRENNYNSSKILQDGQATDRGTIPKSSRSCIT